MRARHSLIFAAVLSALASSAAVARDGDFDRSFAGTGRLRLGYADNVSAYIGTFGPRVRVQSDGAIVLGGTEQQAPGASQPFHVLRLLADGSPDPGFGTSGETTIDFGLDVDAYNQLDDVLVQPDGSILVSGAAAGPSATTGYDCAVARLDGSGHLDTTFSGDGKLTFGFNVGPAGFQTDECSSLLLQHDGQIVVAGSAEINSSGTNTMAVARLNSDGTPDNSFSSNGLSNKRVLDLSPLVQASATTKLVELGTHKLLVIGVGAISSGEDVWTMVRLNGDGSIDPTYGFNGVAIYAFQTGGADIDIPYDAVVLPDDSMVIVGETKIQGNTTGQIAVAKFLPTGGLDTTWGNNGRQVISFGLGGAYGDTGRGIAMDSQGRFVIVGAGDAGGSPDNYDMLAVRLLPDGTFDSSFGVQGKRDVQLSVAPVPDYFEAGLSLAVGADDSVLLGGLADPDGTGNTLGVGVAKLVGDTVFSNGFGG